MYYQHSIATVKRIVYCFLLMLIAGGGTFSASAAGVDEVEYEGKTLVFKLTKPVFYDGTTYDQRVRCSYSVNDLTARYGEDYHVEGGRRGKVVFPAGQSRTVDFKVVLHEDDVDEGDGEKFNLVLTKPQFEAAEEMWLHAGHLPENVKYTGVILDAE